jgi:hypothetical protein
LINVRTTNGSTDSLLLTELQLEVDGFEIPPARERTTSLRSGRTVAIQVPYGRAVDCDGDEPVDARLELTYTADNGTDERRGTLPLSGTELLDTIRAEQCAARRLEEQNRIEFGEPVVEGTALTVDLAIEPMEVDDRDEIEIVGAAGTVLVRAATADGAAPVLLGDEPVVVPLRFSVNRCDPHAMAEVTKRFGLDLSASVDGAEPVAVAVDVAPLLPGLEAIVEACRSELDAD